MFWWDFTIWIEVDTSVIMDRALKRDKEYFGDEEAVRHVYENRCLACTGLPYTSGFTEAKSGHHCHIREEVVDCTRIISERELRQSEIEPK